MSESFASGAAYIQGAYVPIAAANISVFDWGFTRSEIVYDVVHVCDGGFFRLADHLIASFTPCRRGAWHRRKIVRILRPSCTAKWRSAAWKNAYVAMAASRGRPA